MGCSGAGGLGLAPPQNRFTDQTKYVVSASYAPAPLPKELDKSLLPAYVVEPGDTLLVVPVDLDSPIRLPGDQLVEQDGSIDLGQFGRPLVAGKTVEVIEGELNTWITNRAKEQGLDDDAGTDVSVRLVGRVSKVFYVLGEVNAPGAYPITGHETVLDGILTAGGLASDASTKRIILSRPTPPEGCRIALPICYDNIVQLGDTSTNYQLLPGDRIFVASASILDILHDLRNGPCPPCNAMQVPCGVSGTCPPIAGAPAAANFAPVSAVPTSPMPAPAVPMLSTPSAEPLPVPAAMAPPDVYIAPAPAANPVSVPMVVPDIPVLPANH